MIQIIPAVLATTEKQYKDNITKLNSAEVLEGDWVHIDFADNKFVQNQTVDVEVIEQFPTSLHKEAHLMVENPKDWIEKLVKLGFKRVIFHIESKDDILSVIEEIKIKGLEVGLAINSDTDIEKLEPYVDKIDVILIMAVIPGFQGQPFIPEVLDKVKKIKANNWQVQVGIDGAVKDTNIKQIVDSGVEFVVIGSFLIKGNIEENLEIIWEKLSGD
jgi:ribulose-phosphate 3-epimerase